MTNRYADCAILFISSDRYRDIWGNAFGQYSKHWKDCPYKTYLGSNNIVYEGPVNVTTLLSGADRDWSTSMNAILEQITEKYLLVILEDFIIVSDVDTDLVQEHFEYMQLNGINHMHPINKSIKYDEDLNDLYGVYSQGAPYRCNVYGYWNKECLQKLLVPGENPWNFEIMGSYRSSYLDNFLAIKKFPFKIINLVEKGFYIPESVKYCMQNNIQLSFCNRKIMVGTKKNKGLVQEIIFYFINKISWRIRLRLMNFMRKLLSCY